VWKEEREQGRTDGIERRKGEGERAWSSGP